MGSGCPHCHGLATALEGAAPRASPSRPAWEVADVFRLYGEEYRRAHALPPLERGVMHAIEVCRTAALGGHLERCDACGFEQPAYDSCGNRHCPKCQTVAKLRWLEARKAELLPVGYFHNTFTLPHTLNPIAFANKKLIYDMLFHAVADTLKEFGLDPKHLGGKLGFTATLHTWDQQLRYHVHLHCLIPGGALSPDGSRWLRARERFLFHVKALSRRFRRNFCDRLEESFAKGELRFGGKAARFQSPPAFRRLVARLRSIEWVVNSKRPFAGPHKVLDYLSRYTHRVAISNHRIRNVEDGRVTFTWRDRRDHNKVKLCTLGAHEFIRRFLLHTLPKGYHRIRHHGFLANRSKQTGLPRCRQLLGLGAEVPKPPKTSARELLVELAGIDPARCPRCNRGTMRVVKPLPGASGHCAARATSPQEAVRLLADLARSPP